MPTDEQIREQVVAAVEASRAAQLDQERADRQSAAAQFAAAVQPLTVSIDLDADLVAAYRLAGGEHWRLTPSDILSIQVIRLLRRGQESSVVDSKSP